MASPNQSSQSRRVVWDEDNLEKNAEYQRLHPVTMRIDEPKTPYVHIEDEDAEAQDRGEDFSWDPKVNALARQVKEKVASEKPSGPVAPIGKSGRPMLHPKTTTGELEEEQSERQFKQMRRAVYADEGAKFKALLAKQHDDDDDDDDDDNDNGNDNGNEDEDDRTEGTQRQKESEGSRRTSGDSLTHSPSRSVEEEENLTEKQKRFKAKGEMVRMQRVSVDEGEHHVDTPLNRLRAEREQ